MTKLTSTLASLTLTLTATQALAGVVWFDTTAAMRAAAGFPITSRASVTWAYANRSAEAVCMQNGYARGMYTGEQAGELMGVHCFTSDMVTWQDVPFSRISRWAWWDDGITTLDAEVSFKAEATAHNECNSMGMNYGGGFLTGHTGLSNVVGLVCIDRSHVAIRGADANDPRFPALTPPLHPNYSPWYQVRAAANQVCQYHGFATGTADGAVTTGTGVLNLGFDCFY
ncbi:hypothetical protein [Myxococcus stipitatus]|uniref:hypothetical protein n=1 Tax=Myxococcus stipitatus TaxID=83455 RepID=UPI0030CFD9C6